jgi:hypothetical protein
MLKIALCLFAVVAAAFSPPALADSSADSPAELVDSTDSLAEGVFPTHICYGKHSVDTFCGIAGHDPNPGLEQSCCCCCHRA